MATREMVASSKLLQRVIISQNGDMMTGIRELLQNAVDSYHGFESTEERRIEFNFTDRDNITGFYQTMTCRDYGKTLGATEEEVFSNFFIFGESDKTAEEVGEFGIGRGQTMAMIYNPDTYQLEGEHTIRSGNFVIKNINIERLTADIEESEERVDGTVWVMFSMVPKFDVDEIGKFIRDKYRGAIPVYIGDEQVSKTMETKSSKEGDFHATPAADIWFDYNKDYSTGFSVYDRGFYVCEKYPISGWGGTIVTREALKLNFARNEIFDTETWRRVQDFIRRAILAKIRDEDFSECCREKKRGLAYLYVKSVDDRNALKDFPMVELANGKWITPTQLLAAGEVYVASKGSVIAIEGIERGKTVLSKESPFVEFIKAMSVEVIDFSDSSLAAEIARNKFSDALQNSKEHEVLELLNRIFVVPGITFREIRLGVYTDPKLKAWTQPEENVIYVNRTTLKEWTKGVPNSRVPLRAIPQLAHQYAHSSDNRELDDHGYGFCDREAQMFIELIRVYDEYLDQSKFTKPYSPHQRLLLASIEEHMDKNGVTTPQIIMTDEIIRTILEAGGDPQAVYSALMVSLAEHKFVDEEMLDQEGTIKIKRKDLLFNEDRYNFAE
jgi:hypothetical protein